MKTRVTVGQITRECPQWLHYSYCLVRTLMTALSWLPFNIMTITLSYTDAVRCFWRLTTLDPIDTHIPSTSVSWKEETIGRLIVTYIGSLSWAREAGMDHFKRGNRGARSTLHAPGSRISGERCSYQPRHLPSPSVLVSLFSSYRCQVL